MARKYFITGGAGFIGSNYVDRLLTNGHQVTIFDNLSRDGAESNLDWLREKHGEDSFKLIVGDVRDAELLVGSVKDVDVIAHLAGQVAVTTSIENPREDFEINALGTLNVLEAARLSGNNPIVLYSSTNKVYGEMEDVEIIEGESRYSFADLPEGVDETYPLDFHSPYGCSKGAGDQYMRDYHRIYSLPTVVMRQSCIYGPRQFGIEDQGWVAWFIIAAVTGKPITIYGDGKQVRDVLHVHDLVGAYEAAIDNIDEVAGKIYNLGGGPENTMSIWTEFGNILEKLLEEEIQVKWDDWRAGDQKVIICNISKAEKELGWKPTIGVEEGLRGLYNWVAKNRDLFS
jgi:CDP-paratose 2-epimerase